jgi:hypothetical protein
VNWTLGAPGQVFVLANLVISFGYLAVPYLVLPHLPLSRTAVVFGAVFFLGCTGSHMDMVYDVLFNAPFHPHVGWGSAAWHVIQAIGTWGFILVTRSELAKARELVDLVEREVRDGEGD